MDSFGKDGREKRINRIRRPRTLRRPGGQGQLSLVEHALCPLDTAASLTKGLIHKTEYLYTDESRHTQKAAVTVTASRGMLPTDEFYLWGLLALTFRQPEPSREFQATVHYCLKELGCLERTSKDSRGGRNYRDFREALRRLGGVTYESDRFYDPIRGEHRAVSFGLLEYSLPIDPESKRVSRIIWGTLFFEFCQAAGGSLLFDLDTYRELDPASRRLFLALKKVFHRSAVSPVYDVQHLGVNVLGFARSLEMKYLNRKVRQCAEKLAAREIIELPAAGGKGLFEKKGVGSYRIQFRRGRYFEKPQPSSSPALATESAMYEPLKSIGFDDAAIVKIVKDYRQDLIQTWADITLAAIERKTVVFKRSPQAFFMDNLKEASKGNRTAPDWWLEYRKEEERHEREAERHALGLTASVGAEKDAEAAFEEYLRGEAREAVQGIVERKVRDFQELGYSADQAAALAAQEVRKLMRSRFRQEHSEYEKPTGPVVLADILSKSRLLKPH